MTAEELAYQRKVASPGSPFLDHIDLLTAERDQYRRDFVTMSDFAARLTTRLKMQGCTDAEIEAARIEPPIDPALVARSQEEYERGKRAGELIGSEEDQARTDERIKNWLSQHGEDQETAGDLQAALAIIAKQEQRLGEIRKLARGEL